MSRISNLDYLRRVLSGTVTPTDQSPFNFPFLIMKTLGFRLVEVGEGTRWKQRPSSIRIPWEPFMVESCVTSPMRRLVQLISRLFKKGRASSASICRSISFDPFGTRGLERSLDLFTEE